MRSENNDILKEVYSFESLSLHEVGFTVGFHHHILSVTAVCLLSEVNSKKCMLRSIFWTEVFGTGI